MAQLGAQPFLPVQTDSLTALRAAAKSCRGCELYREASQTVFGEGPSPAHIMMVGEQPGDAEDREGHPFVGPAGRLLDKAITEAGLERDEIYLTNTVKHFKHTGSRESKRRIHAKPNQTEISACLPWLEAELKAVRPQLIIVLGSTAAQALLGKAFRVTQQRGTLMPWRGIMALATVHPSSVLRSPGREQAYAGFVEDLKAAAGVRHA
ncbi:MAG TPA: UdgX family uracil-DNA binding protein [Candidatus Limnocylindrales bacterium]|nr:UdgX family uracil-DNA binding protein [Candidatus Limnocylindrales bacterium]